MFMSRIQNAEKLLNVIMFPITNMPIKLPKIKGESSNGAIKIAFIMKLQDINNFYPAISLTEQHKEIRIIKWEH